MKRNRVRSALKALNSRLRRERFEEYETEKHNIAMRDLALTERMFRVAYLERNGWNFVNTPFDRMGKVYKAGEFSSREVTLAGGKYVTVQEELWDLDSAFHHQKLLDKQALKDGCEPVLESVAAPNAAPKDSQKPVDGSEFTGASLFCEFDGNLSSLAEQLHRKLSPSDHAELIALIEVHYQIRVGSETSGPERASTPFRVFSVPSPQMPKLAQNIAGSLSGGALGVLIGMMKAHVQTPPQELKASAPNLPEGWAYVPAYEGGDMQAAAEHLGKCVSATRYDQILTYLQDCIYGRRTYAPPDKPVSGLFAFDTHRSVDDIASGMTRDLSLSHLKAFVEAMR